MSHMRTILTGNDERQTPAWVIKWARNAFGFVLDVCATAANKQATRYFGPDHPHPECRNALAIDWAEHLRDVEPKVVWMNPPYSRGSLWNFLEKADEEANKGVTTIALLPADTSTQWYHAFCEGRPTFFIKGRLKFGPGFKKPAPFPSMIVLFTPPLEG